MVAYDNINFMDRKWHEQAGHTPVYRSFTNAVYSICEYIPATGLNASMHDPTVSLNSRDVILSPGITDSEGIGPKISRSLIADAVKRLHTSAVNEVFSGERLSQYPEFPTMNRLPARKTEFMQFVGIKDQ